MTATARSGITVRVFVPDGGGYISFDSMSEDGKAAARERVFGQVRRARELRGSAQADDAQRAEAGRCASL